MDQALRLANQFVGLKAHNLQFAYNSEATGTVYSVVQLVPETQPQGASILRRIFGKPVLG
ncbi:hypothetical protein D3C80_2172200 [compost metagenome]